METGCDPSLLLNRQSRFRHVCPLLKQNAQGVWLCSVDTKDVRPFWGRALGLVSGGIVILYLLATLAAFSFLRTRGYPVSYYDVSCPPAWSHFHTIQSRYFAQKASRALSKRDPGEAVMALSIAYQLDRSNFSLGLLFARLSQVSQPALSDQVYQQLLHDHPSRRLEVYTAWYEALLWRADFDAILDVARDALFLDSEHRAAWINSLLFALHRQPNPRVLAELSNNAPADCRGVFTLELQSLEGGSAASRALMSAASASEKTPFYSYYLPRRLIDLGFANEALVLLTRESSTLPVRDAVALRLEAFEKNGARATLREQLRALLQQPMNPATSQLLSGFFVRHREPELFRTAFDVFKTSPAASAETAYADWAGWLCAAGANNEFTRFDEAAVAMRKLSGSEFRASETLKRFFQSGNAGPRIESLLPSIQPLPLDVTYALLERYYQTRADKPAVAHEQ